MNTELAIERESTAETPVKPTEREAIDRVLDHLWMDHLDFDQGVYHKEVVNTWKEKIGRPVNPELVGRAARRLEAGRMVVNWKDSNQGMHVRPTEAGVDVLFDCIADHESYELMLAITEQLTPTKPKH